MPALSADSAFWALDLALRATLILALASLIAALLARASAALRHVVWTSAVAALLALPFLVIALPAWRALPRWNTVPTPPSAVASKPLALPSQGNSAVIRTPPSTPAPISTDANPVSPSTIATADPLPSPPTSAPPPAPPSTPASTTSLTWPTLLLATWLLGTATLLSPLAVAALALHRLRRAAAPCTLPLAAQLLAECRRDFALRRRVHLLVAPGAAPMTFGILRPHILLPEGSAAWSPDRWRLVLRHELAHIQRHDLLTQTLAQLMRALYWFHPLAWLACARMAAERERACDDLTLAGTEPAAYAAELFAVAQSSTQSSRHAPRAVPLPLLHRLASAAAVPMARLSSLESRVRAILDTHRNRRRLTGTLLLSALLAALAVLLPIATLRAADRPTASSATSAANANLASIAQALAAYSSSQPTSLPAPSPALLAFLQAEVDRAKAAFDDTAELDAAKAQLAQDQAALADLQKSPVPQTMAVENLTQKIALGQARVESALNRRKFDELAYNQALKRLQDIKNGTPSAPVTAAVDPDQMPTVAILGQVKSSGMYNLTRNLATVGDLIAVTGLNTSDLDQSISLYRRDPQGAAVLIWSKPLRQVMGTLLQNKDLLMVGEIRSLPVVDPALIAIQEAEVDIAKHRADNTAAIDAEKAVVESKQKDLARQQALPVPAAELEQARLAVIVALARLRVAESQHEEDVLRFKQANAGLQAVKNGVAPADALRDVAVQDLVAHYHPQATPAEDEAALALAKHRADDMADVDGCKAMVEHAQINVERVKNLYDKGLIAQGELDQATAELAQNRAQLARAVSQHEEEILKYKLLQQQIQSHKPAASVDPAGTIVPADADLPPDQPGEFYVLGVVPRPGVYSLTGRKITVKQALAATGIDPANFPRLLVTLTRRSGNNTETIIHNIRPDALFAGTEPDRFLQPNDILKVESTATTQPATAPASSQPK